MILTIDPGNIESGYVLIREKDLKVLEKGKINNQRLLDNFQLGLLTIEDKSTIEYVDHVAIEMIASYGMPVGQSVFETCLWVGKFSLVAEEFNIEPKLIYRQNEKMNLCGSMKAKDSNIIQALIDRFAPNTPNKGKGTKKEPGWFYGFKKDIWQAYAVGVTYHDMYLNKEGGLSE
jgi:hypothetical protein